VFYLVYSNKWNTTNRNRLLSQFSMCMFFPCIFLILPLLLNVNMNSFACFAVHPSSIYLLTVGVEGFYFSLDHTQTHPTVGRTPLDEGSARRRDLCLVTQTLYKRQTTMPLVGFEPAIPASARRQTYALDRAATGIGQ
jgi:hypothetical protein